MTPRRRVGHRRRRPQGRRGALLALALVRPWGRAIPRRLLLGTAWAASAVLTAYGGLLVAVGALVLTGLVSPSGPVDRMALR